MNGVAASTPLRDYALRAWQVTAWRLVVVLLSTTLPRLVLAGGLPSTDEGFYAYHAQVMHAALTGGHGLPASSLLMLYPLLLCWVFALGGNALVLLRLLDLIVASLAGWLLSGLLARRMRNSIAAAVLSFLVLFVMNNTSFVQNGFKNSMFAAYVPLFLAVGVGAAMPRRAMLAGVLVACAVLLRETFLPFAILGVVAVWLQFGRRRMLAYCFGGLVGVIAILLPVLILRGNLIGLLDAYHRSNQVYDGMAREKWPFFIMMGYAFVQLAAPLLVLATVSAAGLLWCGWRRAEQGLLRIAVFGVTVAILPLLEPALKIGFPYHFAVTLPGLALLIAYGWGHIIEQAVSGWRHGLCGLLLLCCGWSLWQNMDDLLRRWPESKIVLRALPSPQWPAALIGRSNYLLAAQKISAIARPGDTLSVSGFMHVLYPLTGMLPPDDTMSNLSGVLLEQQLDQQRFLQRLRRCPATLVMTTSRADWPGSMELEQAVAQSELYQQFDQVEVNPTLSYGTFGGKIYRRNVISQPPLETCTAKH